MIRRFLTSIPTRRFSVSSFASMDPGLLSASRPYAVRNLVGGQWKAEPKVETIQDPLNGDNFLTLPLTQLDQIDTYVKNLNDCPKSGLHNPFKNVERYIMLGDVCARVAQEFRNPEVTEFFSRLIQRVAPKHFAQAKGEVDVVRKFFENFSGDQVRFLARGFSVPGDRYGQQTNGYRWPYGPVVIIAPFNFPLEIPIMQMMGALFMGNKVLLKCDSKVAVVMEQALRMLHSCGLPQTDVDFINCDGPTMHQLLLKSQPRMTQFTGSSRVAEMLARDLKGKIKIEDAGFDWKILGPDANASQLDMIAHVCDQDAYAFSGQKCSAQSMLFMHSNWAKLGFIDRLEKLASRRNLQDLTLGPILSWDNVRIQSHITDILALPGAKILFGGNPLRNHRIPPQYGAFEPTAVFVPIEEMLANKENFDVCTTELFGPFQVVTEYNDSQLPMVLNACERMHAHLTAAIVSNDTNFQNHVISNTVNGTTYVGYRARTTGAPQNHWFGPAGDPRGAGIGTPEAIRLVWSCHREVILDETLASKDWTTPTAT